MVLTIEVSLRAPGAMEFCCHEATRQMSFRDDASAEKKLCYSHLLGQVPCDLHAHQYLLV